MLPVSTASWPPPCPLTLHLYLGGGVTPITAGARPVTVTDTVSGIIGRVTITVGPGP